MRMNRPILGALVALSTALIHFPVMAQSPPAQREATAASAAMTEGEVRKIDKDAQKITIRHGPIVNLDMPAMTMVFRVKDPAMLDQVKPADKIRFTAESLGGTLTVTRIETAR